MTELHRSYVPELEIVRSEADKQWAGVVEGIAVPYGQAQRIDDTLTEQFARGAFDHQIDAMHRVHVAREHVSLGGAPIGRILDATDDAAGLRVRMGISATERGEETLTLLRDEVLSHLSIGFRQSRPSHSVKLRSGVVERRRADLTELSIVLRGAYGPRATVTGVRADEDEQDERPPLTLDEARALVASIPVLPAGVLVR